MIVCSIYFSEVHRSVAACFLQPEVVTHVPGEGCDRTCSPGELVHVINYYPVTKYVIHVTAERVVNHD